MQLSTRRVHSATQRKRALYFSFTLLKQLASKKRPDLSRNCKQKATRSASVTDDQSALSSDEKILHLIVLCSNLQILFTETHALKMSNLNLRRFARAKQCRYFSRRRGWGIVKGEGALLPRLCLATAEQSAIQALTPPLFFLQQSKNNLRRLFFCAKKPSLQRQI